MLYVPTISKQQEQLDGHCACQLWQCPWGEHGFRSSPPQMRSYQQENSQWHPFWGEPTQDLLLDIQSEMCNVRGHTKVPQTKGTAASGTTLWAHYSSSLLTCLLTQQGLPSHLQWQYLSIKEACNRLEKSTTSASELSVLQKKTRTFQAFYPLWPSVLRFASTRYITCEIQITFYCTQW